MDRKTIKKNLSLKDIFCIFYLKAVTHKKEEVKISEPKILEQHQRSEGFRCRIDKIPLALVE